MRAKITPSFVTGATAEPGKERSIYWDSDLAGFGLMVTTSGAKSFVVQYRNERRQSRRMTISAELKLGAARKKARQIIGDVAKGSDPLAEKRKVALAAGNTLQAVCENYFRREGRKLRTAGERQRRLALLVYPRLGSRQIEDVRRSDVVKLLDKIEDENGASMADHALSYLRRVMNWHSLRDDSYRSPIVRGMKRLNGNARSRTLSDDEIRRIWAATRTLSGAFPMLVKFLLLTATRRNEAARMKRSEVDGDVWTIPASRYKGNHDHAVPLSKAAQKIIAATPVIDGSDLVFTNDGWRPVSPSRLKAQLDAESGVAGWVLHDLRRSARSLMSRAGVNADVAEMCLGHVLRGVRGIYDRHSYSAEKRQAFETLAAQIERIVNPLSEKVVPLRAAP